MDRNETGEGRDGGPIAADGDVVIEPLGSSPPPCGSRSAKSFGPYWVIRLAIIGTEPPAWQKMKRMSLQRVSVPENNRLMTVRVVSCGTSAMMGEVPGIRVRQQLGMVGCTKTTALRRLSSSSTGW